VRPANGRPASPDGAQTYVPRLVLFDFDGVLVRGDAFTKWLGHRFARAWLVVPVSLLVSVLLPVAATARGRRLLVRVIVTLAFVGLDEASYRRSAHEFGCALARDTRLLSRAAFAALDTHRQSGDRVVVVTGCEEALARAILDEHGVGPIELIASRVVRGRFGLRIAVRNVGREKLRQLALRGIHPKWDVA